MDITIYGAGIFGLSIAWMAVQRGASVQVIDPNGPGSGASGGVLGALAPHSPDGWNAKKQGQLDSLIMAERFWHEVEETAEQPSGYGRIGRLQPIDNERGLELAKARAIAARQNWPEAFQWEIRALDDWPYARGMPQQHAVWDTLSARIDPARALAVLCTALRRSGVRIIAEGAPKGLIAHATGHEGLTSLTAAFGREIGRAEKGQAARLALDLGDVPQIYAQSVHIVPQANGTVAVGSTSEREFNHLETDEKLDQIIEKATIILPPLQGATVLQRWAGLRPRSATRAPVLGAWPGRKGHFVANGGFKTGFGMAPLVARLITDLMLSDKDDIPDSMRLECNPISVNR